MAFYCILTKSVFSIALFFYQLRFYFVLFFMFILFILCFFEKHCLVVCVHSTENYHVNMTYHKPVINVQKQAIIVIQAFRALSDIIFYCKLLKHYVALRMLANKQL